MRTNFRALPLVLAAFSSVFPTYALLVLSANSKHQIYGVKISTNYGNVLLGKGWGTGALGSPGTKRLYSWVSFDNDVVLLTSDLDVFVNNQYFGKAEKGADLRVDAGGVSINGGISSDGKKVIAAPAFVMYSRLLLRHRPLNL